MLLRSHGGGNCSGDGGAHEGGPDLHPTEEKLSGSCLSHHLRTRFNTVFGLLVWPWSCQSLSYDVSSGVK